MPTFECQGFARSVNRMRRSGQYAEHEQPWFRDGLLCEHCGSIPRERAITNALMKIRPNFRDLSVHEGSPSNRGLSLKLKQQCHNTPHHNMIRTFQQDKFLPIKIIDPKIRTSNICRFCV